MPTRANGRKRLYGGRTRARPRQIINTPNVAVRREQLAACRRHLDADGSLLFERFDPDWLAEVEPGPAGRMSEDVALHVDRISREGNIVEVSLRYSTHSEEWRQHFPAQVLGDSDVERLLTEAGFASVEWIGKRWGRAS